MAGQKVLIYLLRIWHRGQKWPPQNGWTLILCVLLHGTVGKASPRDKTHKANDFERQRQRGGREKEGVAIAVWVCATLFEIGELAMASTASTLSWSSSSWLHSFGGNVKEVATKLPDRRTSMVILAQKKAKKTRTVNLTNGFSFSFSLFLSFMCYMWLEDAVYKSSAEIRETVNYICIIFDGAVTVVVSGNSEGGCSWFRQARAASQCQGWVLQELSSSNRQSPDCHSCSAQVMHYWTIISLFILWIALEFFEFSMVKLWIFDGVFKLA